MYQNGNLGAQPLNFLGSVRFLFRILLPDLPHFLEVGVVKDFRNNFDLVFALEAQ